MIHHPMKHNSDFSCKVNVIFSTVSPVVKNMKEIVRFQLVQSAEIYKTSRLPGFARRREGEGEGGSGNFITINALS